MKRTAPLVVTGVIGLLAVAVLHWYGAHLIDLSVYRRGAEAVVSGRSPYAVHRGDQLPFTYPPFAAVLLLPTAWWSWPVTYVAWTLLTTLCLIWLWDVCRRHSTMPSTLFYPGLVGSLLLEPVWTNFHLGQINLLLVATILADLARPAGARGRGFWLGVTIGIKLTPVVFLPFLLVTRQWRALRNATAGFVFTVGVGWLVLPRESVTYWSTMLLNTGRVPDPIQSGNQSWMGALLRANRVLSGETLPWLALAAATLVLCLVCARSWWLRGERLLALSITGVAGLLASPVSWTHHWVWCVPLGVALHGASRRAGVGPRGAGAVTALWFGCFVVAPQTRLPHLGNRELLWSPWQNLVGDLYVWVALLAVGYLMVLERRTQPARDTASTPVDARLR